MPDTYQGTELHDDSLVDPDNRRPVDYARATRLLGELDADASAVESKLFVASRALRLRRDHAGVFAGDYIPLVAVGSRGDHVFAFLRSDGNSAVLVAVPRLIHGMVGDDPWGDTTLTLPEPWANRTWRSAFTDETYSPTQGVCSVSELFAPFPVALLIAT